MKLALNLPPLPEGFTYRLDLAPAATTRLLKKRPVHRWFYFPHSYSPELVEAVLDEWGLPPGSSLLDPFVGAGTTLLAAKQRGLSAVGLDISPLAVRVSNAKIACYERMALEDKLRALLRDSSCWAGTSVRFNGRLARAFNPREANVLLCLRDRISKLDDEVAGFFWLPLLVTAKMFSRAVADGGWYRWVEKPNKAEEIMPVFECNARAMIEEVDGQYARPGTECQAIIEDGRMSYRLDRQFDALITSPPYPNRHDYSRVYQIELLLMGYGEADVFDIRFRSVRSHVEAHPIEREHLATASPFEIPPTLRRQLEALPIGSDPRIPKMMEGYFSDLYSSLASAAPLLKARGKSALVVGNVRHCGTMFPVDAILAEVGQQAGFTWSGTWVIRLRGNSAQQMGRYGREPSRESVVFLEKT